MVVFLYHGEGRFLQSLVLSVLNLVLKYEGSQMKIATPLAAAAAISLFKCMPLAQRSDLPLPDFAYVRR